MFQDDSGRRSVFDNLTERRRVFDLRRALLPALPVHVTAQVNRFQSRIQTIQSDECFFVQDIKIFCLFDVIHVSANNTIQSCTVAG